MALVELRSGGGVAALRVGRTVGSEVVAGGAVATVCHAEGLIGTPGIKVGGADEGDMDTHSSVAAGAVHAEEGTVCNGAPRGVVAGTVEALFVFTALASIVNHFAGFLGVSGSSVSCHVFILNSF